MTASGSTTAALADLTWLRGLAAVVAADADDADELVQETLIAAWAKPPPDAESPLRPWLGAVLRNRFRMMRRGQARRQERERASEPAAPTSAEPEPAFERLEILRVLITELEALPADDREILVRRFFDGLSAADMGRALDMPAATVRSRIHRSLSRLRDALDRRFAGRHAWCAALGLPPMVGAGPITGGHTMSITMKGLLIAGAVTTVGGAAWAASRSPVTKPTDAGTTAPALADREDATPRRVWEGRRERIHRALAEVPPVPTPGPPAFDEERLQREHDSLREQIDACLDDLESDANGALTVDIVEIGAPDVGVIYESIEPVAETLRDPAAMECILEGMYAFVGDPPDQPYRRTVTSTMQIGSSDDPEVARRRVFETIVGAHISEIRFCETKVDAPLAGPFAMTFTIADGGVVAAAIPDPAGFPESFLACATTAGMRWKFPETLVGRTFVYDFVLPMPDHRERNPDGSIGGLVGGRDESDQ